MNAMMLMTYRANFINSMIATIAWGLFSLFSVVILTSNTSSLYGWSRNELLLLNGYYGLIIGVFHVFFSRNLERFSQVIHFGELDAVLLKPLDSQFMLSLWMVNFASIMRLIIAGCYVWVVASGLSLTFDIGKVIVFASLSLFSIVLLYSLWFCVITLTIWFTKLSNVVELLYNITGMARYPQEMYMQLSWLLMAMLIPVTLLIATPAKVYLQRGTIQDCLMLIGLAVVFFAVSRKFWHFALRYYTSASS
jgi:ABC-2 type transport system permease protein